MNSSVHGVNNLLDISRNSKEIIKTESEFNITEFSLDENQRILIKMENNGKKELVFPETILAFVFKSLLEILKDNNLTPSSLTISVPDDSSFHQRKSILNALEITGIGESKINLIDEMCAGLITVI